MPPAYVVNSDFEKYPEGWVTDDAQSLNRLLERAEHYVDLMAAGRPVVVPATDAIHKLSIEGGPTAGTFTLSLSWEGVTYTTGVLPFNATYSQISSAINTITGFPGEVGVMGGPLPHMDVYLSFRGGLRGLPVEQGASTSFLTGTNPITITFEVAAAGGVVGRRFNPSQLSLENLLALKNAVCAQAEYMDTSKDSLFIEGQYASVKGPDFATQGRLPVVAPKAKRELALAGFVTSTARARA